MDINSNFILSDIAYLADNFPQNAEKLEQNLRFHILSPEEKASWSEPAVKTACKVHFSLTRNLYLYSYNPSSGKLLKKITARVLIVPSSIFEWVLKAFNDLAFLITFTAQTVAHNRTSTITDPELKEMYLFTKLKKDPLFLSWIESYASKAVSLAVLFSNDCLACPGIKVHNKTLDRDEFMLDLGKIEALKKYYGWDDATDQEIHTLLEQSLKDSRAEIEYEIKDGSLEWNYIKLPFQNVPFTKRVNSLIDKGLLKDVSKWKHYS